MIFISRWLQSKFTSNLAISAILIFLTFITYVNILPNQLFFDDEELIYKNAYIQNLRFFPKYFTENMIAGAGKISNMYRPILTLSFATDYFIWRGNPLGFHLTSIILHAANAILIFFLIYKLFNTRFVSFLTTIFFIVHPVQTEAIIYASGRTDPLYTFFALITLLLLVSLIHQSKVNILKYIATIFFFLLSLLSKETAIVLPILLILIFLTQPSKRKYNLKKIIFFLLPFFLLDAIYVFLRLTALDFGGTLNFYTQTNLTPQTAIYSQNILVRLYTFTKVFFDYLGIIFFPKDLIFARNSPIITTFLNPWVVGFLIAAVLLLVISIKTWQKNRIFLFALFWFFIAILPVSGIIPINNIIAEHYLYLPSLSFFLITSHFINWLFHKTALFEIRSTSIIILFIIISILTVRTIIRTFDWRDPIIFYTRSLQQSPENIPMRHNLAMSYASIGQPELAIKQYQQIIALADVYPNTHHNLANAYKALGKYEEAEEEYKKAIEMDPKFLFSYYALADLYKKTGNSTQHAEIMDKLKKFQKD